jgi:hypothetical protein
MVWLRANSGAVKAVERTKRNESREIRSLVLAISLNSEGDLFAVQAKGIWGVIDFSAVRLVLAFYISELYHLYAPGSSNPKASRWETARCRTWAGIDSFEVSADNAITFASRLLQSRFVYNVDVPARVVYKVHVLQIFGSF